MRRRRYDGTYMKESPLTVYASLCAVGKNHTDRVKIHNFLEVHNINCELNAVRETSSKSRCVVLKRYLVTGDKKKYVPMQNRVTLEELCLPIDFVPSTNIDRRNHIELLDALYICKEQSYSL